MASTFTIRKGRRGFNGNLLASMPLSEAYKAFAKVPKEVVKEAHEEAVKISKELNKEAVSDK